MTPRRLAVLAALATGLAACNDAPTPPTYLRVAGGEPERGRTLMLDYGCGTCHVIEGVYGARGTVGPTLNDYAQRTMLAGILPNVPRNLVAWLIDPVALDPRTGMPNMGVTEAQARDMAAYLYTLGADEVAVYPNGPPLRLQGRERPVLQAGEEAVIKPNPATAPLAKPEP